MCCSETPRWLTATFDGWSPESPAATETSASSHVDVAVQIAAYGGAAMGLVGTFALVALNADPSDTTILLVAVVVTAGVARRRRSGQERPPCVEPAPAERPVVRLAVGVGRRRRGESWWSPMATWRVGRVR
jgi:hypothetical protein